MQRSLRPCARLKSTSISGSTNSTTRSWRPRAIPGPGASCGAHRVEEIQLPATGQGKARQRAYWFKTQPVQGSRSILLDGAAVLRRRVALVRGQSVFGKDRVPRAHAGVALYFGQNGS